MESLLVYLGIFLAVFGESTLIVGAFVPGLNTIIVTSFLANTGSLNFPVVYVAAWLGMFCGDMLGYVLGRYGLDRIQVANRWFTKVRPDVEKFTQNHRRLMVFYQFVGAARSPLPVLLGAVNHPFRQWLVLLTASTTIFITVVAGTSYLLGGLVERKTAITIAIVAQVIIAVIFAVYVTREVLARQKGKLDKN